MKVKHIFVPALDVGELLPFGIKNTKKLDEDLDFQEKSKKELVKFINKLEKNFNEEIYYVGMDIIGEKAYERFLFEKGGFLEIMMEEPVAINAHFVSEARGKKFAESLKRTLKQILPKGEVSNMFIDNIQVQDEQDSSLSVKKWTAIKKIRNLE